jgi:hypothetical protein
MSQRFDAGKVASLRDCRSERVKGVFRALLLRIAARVGTETP